VIQPYFRTLSFIGAPNIWLKSQFELQQSNKEIKIHRKKTGCIVRESKNPTALPSNRTLPFLRSDFCPVNEEEIFDDIEATLLVVLNCVLSLSSFQS